MNLADMSVHGFFLSFFQQYEKLRALLHLSVLPLNRILLVVVPVWIVIITMCILPLFGLITRSSLFISCMVASASKM
jgi:hypothetical protein